MFAGVVGTFLVLISVTVQAAEQGPVAAPAETADEASRWILSTEEPVEGRTFGAWLVLGPDEPTELRIELHPTPELDGWFVTNGEPCEAGARASRPAWTELSRTAGSPTILQVCAIAQSRHPTRLIALLNGLPTTTEGTAPQDARHEVLASEPVTARARFTPSPVLMAILTSLLGFMGGFLTHLAQKSRESRLERRQRKERLAELVAENVLPELKKNYEKIRAFNQGSTRAPDLDLAGYNRALTAEGVLGFLTDQERADYLDWLNDLVACINLYQSAVNRGQETEVATLARKVEEKLERRMA